MPRTTALRSLPIAFIALAVALALAFVTVLMTTGALTASDSAGASWSKGASTRGASWS